MAVPRPPIRPRSAWAAGLPAVGSLTAEEDVRFLLVHHTATPTAPPASAAAQLRGFFSFHTGTKGWPDIAYNFLVDPGGTIWEGRTGSLAGPVRGDATGGSQGFAILCCFIGDFSAQPPPDAALTAMSELLAWLADRYDVDLAPGAEVSFVSRGSDRWPAGQKVTTATVAGHRDMSQTTCPGDAAYRLIDARLRPRAHALVEQAAGPASTSGGDTRSTSSTGRSRPTRSASAPDAGTASTGRTAEAGAPDRDVLPGVLGAVGAAAAASTAWVLARRMRQGGTRR